MNLFQKHLLFTIARHPGATSQELALTFGLPCLNANKKRYLRWLEDTGQVISKRVRLQGKTFVKVYRVA